MGTLTGNFSATESGACLSDGKGAHDFRSIRRAALLLIAATLLAYVPAMHGGFIWDDDSYVTDNLALRNIHGLRAIWLTIGATKQYYPLVHTTFWVEYHLWGLNPVGFHMGNILLHAANALLLWAILRRLRAPGAWMAAAIFALHPVCVESVAWITERKNVLSGFFYLCATLAYFRFAGVEEPLLDDKRRWRYYALALALFACALLSKTVTATLPAAVLLVLWWKRDRIRWRDVAPLVPMFVMGIAAGQLTAWMEKNVVGAQGGEWALTPVERVLIAGRALWFYAAKLLLPINLAFIYPRWQIQSNAPWQYIFPIGVLGVIAVLWFFRVRIGKGPLAGALFFCGTLFPALGFFDIFPMRYSWVADHFQYLASIGLIVLGVALGAGWSASFFATLQRAAWAGTAILLIVLGTLTWRQGYIYGDLETLWRDTLRKNPDCWMAHNNLGCDLLGQAHYDEALSHFQDALRLMPPTSLMAPVALASVGNVFLAQGKFEEAVASYERALQRDPRSDEAHARLGITLAHLGRLDKAVVHLREAKRLKPERAEHWNNLGQALARQGKIDEAISEFNEALSIKGDFAECHGNLGIIFAQTGRAESAIFHFRQALKSNPDWVPALNKLAWILATNENAELRDPPEAVRLAERASEFTGGAIVDVQDTLAAAYAAAGRFAEAVQTAKAAQGRASSQGNEKLAAEIRHRVELYESGLPYRETALLPLNTNSFPTVE